MHVWDFSGWYLVFSSHNFYAQPLSFVFNFTEYNCIDCAGKWHVDQMIRTMRVLKQTQKRDLNDTESFCWLACKHEEIDIVNDEYCDNCDEDCDECFRNDMWYCDSCYCTGCKEKHSSNETSAEVPTTTDTADSDDDGLMISSEDSTTTDTVDYDDGLMKKINNVKKKLEIPPKRHRGRQNANKQSISNGKGKNGKSAGKISNPMGSK